MEDYGDHSSAYWPPGWNFDRFSKAGSSELLGLPEGELHKLQAGFRNALGEAGAVKLADYVFRLAQSREKEATAANTNTTVQQPATLLPNWLRQWKRRHQDQPWGFVAMQTTCYDDPDRWKKFKEEFRKIVEIPFQRDSSFPDVSTAKAKFEIRWIEDPILDQASVDVLRDRYKQLESELPGGLSQNIFLSTSARSIDSVLNIADTDEAPSTESKRWRPLAPYILAVSAFAQSGLDEDHEERNWFRPVFKVAAEVLVDEFWSILDSDIMPLRRITRHIEGVDVNDQAPATQASNGFEDMWWSVAPSPQRLRKRRRIQ